MSHHSVNASVDMHVPSSQNSAKNAPVQKYTILT